MNRLLFTMLMALLLIPTAGAVPLLQLYVEGGTYDAGTESWVLGYTSDPIRLWVIGNVAGPGSQGTIYDTKLAIAYDTPESGHVDLPGAVDFGHVPHGDHGAVSSSALLIPECLRRVDPGRAT